MFKGRNYEQGCRLLSHSMVLLTEVKRNGQRNTPEITCLDEVSKFRVLEQTVLYVLIVAVEGIVISVPFSRCIS